MKPTTLTPLSADPITAPASWAAAPAGGFALLRVDLPMWQDWQDHRAERGGMAQPPAEGRWPAQYWTALAAAVERLVMRGVRPLARVGLGYGTRPLPDVLGEINAWAVLPVCGVFLDQAPASAGQTAPVAQAVHAVRRAGLPTVALNPGVPVDRVYRGLDAIICTFEGSWAQYRRWSGEGGEPGDGHLIHGVPPAEHAAATALAAARRAGLILISGLTAAAPAEYAAGGGE